MLRSSEPVELQFHIYDSITGTSSGDQGCDIGGTQSSTDFGAFRIPFKCSVFEAQALITENCAGTSAEAEIRFDRRFTAGSNTGRTDADVGRIIIGDATGSSAAGDQVYDRAGAGVTLEPGMEVVVQVLRGCDGGAGASGKFWPMLLVNYEPEKRSNVTQLEETA